MEQSCTCWCIQAVYDGWIHLFSPYCIQLTILQYTYLITVPMIFTYSLSILVIKYREGFIQLPPYGSEFLFLSLFKLSFDRLQLSQNHGSFGISRLRVLSFLLRFSFLCLGVWRCKFFGGLNVGLTNVTLRVTHLEGQHKSQLI